MLNPLNKKAAVKRPNPDRARLMICLFSVENDAAIRPDDSRTAPQQETPATKPATRAIFRMRLI